VGSGKGVYPSPDFFLNFLKATFSVKLFSKNSNHVISQATDVTSQTDGRTDGRLSHGNTAFCVASRGKQLLPPSHTQRLETDTRQDRDKSLKVSGGLVVCGMIFHFFAVKIRPTDLILIIRDDRMSQRPPGRVPTLLAVLTCPGFCMKNFFGSVTATMALKY